MRAERAAAWAEAERVLCVRLDSLGDVLMTTPAMRALKESRPGRRLTLLTSPVGAAAAALVPEVDDVIVYEAPWMKAPPPRTDAAPDLHLIQRLARGRFDAAAIFTVCSQSSLPAALTCYLAGVPLRLAHCRENPYQLLTDWAPDPEPEVATRHEVQRQLDLVATVGCRTANERLSLRVPAEARRGVLRLLAAAGVDLERPWFVVHPGASAPSRRYPAEQFAAAAAALARALGARVVVTGGADERELAARVAAGIGMPALPLAGVLSLAELAALLELAPLLICNNSGPAHIAAALGTPIVDLYALTNPQHTPWQAPSRVLSHDVPCRNCRKSVCPQGHHDCLRLVRPAEVAEAALALLAETHPAAAGGGVAHGT